MTKPPKIPSRITRGEIATPAGYLYELSGGELCLDFANTLDSRPTDEPRELLADYDDLVRWGVQTQALTPGVANGLLARAAGHRRQAATVLRQARALREAVFALFSAAARSEAPPSSALPVLNQHLSRVFTHLRLAGGAPDYRWVWDDENALERMLWPVARSAGELLASDRLDRVRVCSAEDCDWLFLDQSKNRSRRWCDMTVCGNRSKVRRFRLARRQSGESKSRESHTKTRDN